jgi:hypothetical protein
MPLFGRKKKKYNLLSNERSSFNKSKNNACKRNDYKCKYEQCESDKNMKGRPLPSLPRQKTRKSSKEENMYAVPQPLYRNVTMRRKPSPPSEHTYDLIVGGTRRRKHMTKSAHKKRGYGKRSMHKRGYGKRTMHKRGKRSTRKRGKSTHKNIVGGFHRSSEDIINDFNGKSDNKKCEIFKNLDVPDNCSNPTISFNNLRKTIDKENQYGDVLHVSNPIQNYVNNMTEDASLLDKPNCKSPNEWCKRTNKCHSPSTSCLQYNVWAAPPHPVNRTNKPYHL